MPTEADLLIVNARPWTDGASCAGADAVALAGGRVLALGRAAELAALAGPRTRRVDARGATVTPGLWDAHIHLRAWALARRQLALRDAGSASEVAARVRTWLAAHPGEAPVIGHGWDAETWRDAPTRAALDAVAPERPVVLHSHDFHAVWVNGAALRVAGVTRATADPAGGRFERDAAGEPTGVAREHAVRAFAALEAGVADDEPAALRDAVGALHALGVVGVHDMDPGPAARRGLQALAHEGRLRVLKAVGHLELDEALAGGWTSGTGDARFRLGALKLFADGTLGSRTAALLEPYEGTADAGMELMPPAELRAVVARALAGGLAVAVHAIGDRAVRATLDAFDAAGETRRRAPLPCRVEHVQLAHRADLARFAALGVAASVQPLHCTADIDLVERHWGARRERSYPWASLRAAGATLAFGSDAPVESPSVAAGLHAAVTRARADGAPPGGFVPAERVPLDAALAAYTESPARLAGLWPDAGRLAPGALGDVVVWDRDLHAAPAAELHRAEVALTVLDGRVVHARAGEHATVGGPAR